MVVDVHGDFVFAEAAGAVGLGRVAGDSDGVDVFGHGDGEGFVFAAYSSSAGDVTIVVDTADGGGGNRLSFGPERGAHFLGAVLEKDDGIYVIVSGRFPGDCGGDGRGLFDGDLLAFVKVDCAGSFAEVYAHDVCSYMNVGRPRKCGRFRSYRLRPYAVEVTGCELFKVAGWVPVCLLIVGDVFDASEVAGVPFNFMVDGMAAAFVVHGAFALDPESVNLEVIAFVVSFGDAVSPPDL